MRNLCCSYAGRSYRIGSLAEIKADYLEARSSAQKRIDKIPLYRAGLRAMWIAIRDKTLGKGAIFVS
jgi:hypothetical protein